MKRILKFLLIVLITGATAGCKKDTCFECRIFVDGINDITDQECGKDLTFNEAYKTIEKRNPNSTGGMYCKEL